MANGVLLSYRKACMQGAGPNLLTSDLKFVLVDAADFPGRDDTTDEFLSTIPVGARNSTTANLANKVILASGALDADDTTLPDAGGDAAEYLYLYQDTGVEATSRLLAVWDTVSGLPLTGDNVNDLLQFAAQGIFAL